MGNRLTAWVCAACVVCMVGCAAQNAQPSSSGPTPDSSSQSVSSEYQKASENIVLETSVSGESGVDLSSVSKVYEYADLVVTGTVKTVSLASYRQGKFLPYSDVTFLCEETLKGTASGEITFSVGGGLVPAATFLAKDPTAKKGEGKNIPENKIKDGFVNVKTSKRPQLVEGEKYVFFLKKWEDGSVTTASSDYSVLEIKNGVLQDFAGTTYSTIG